MKKFDDIVLNEIKKYTGGAEPEAYIYCVKNTSLWLFILLGLWAQTPYIMAARGEQFLFLRCNFGGNKFKGEYFILHKSDIQDVKFKKFVLSHYITIIKKDNTKLRIMASPKYIRLTNQAENLNRIKQKLGI